MFILQLCRFCSASTVNVFTKFNFPICHTRLQMLRLTANIEIVDIKANNFFSLKCRRYSRHLTKFNFLSIIDKDILMSGPVTTKNISPLEPSLTIAWKNIRNHISIPIKRSGSLRATLTPNTDKSISFLTAQQLTSYSIFS